MFFILCNLDFKKTLSINHALVSLTEAMRNTLDEEERKMHLPCAKRA